MTTDRPDDLTLLTTAEACDLMKISANTLGRIVDRGELPTVIVGDRRRFRLSAIREYLERKET